MLCAEVVDSPESGAAVERADATTRNHHVELTIFHVVADVGNHDHHLLALQSGGTCVGRVTAVAVKCKEETRSARSCVACARTGCKGIGEVVVDGERCLAVAKTGGTAVTNALDHVIAFCESLLLGITGFCDRTALSTPCAMGLATVPVTATPAVSGTSASLELEIGGVALCDGAARGLCAGTGLCRRARRLLLLLLRAGRLLLLLLAAGGFCLLGSAASRCGATYIFAVFIIGIVIALYAARIVEGVLFALGTRLFSVVVHALARYIVVALIVALVVRSGGGRLRLLLLFRRRAVVADCLLRRAACDRICFSARRKRRLCTRCARLRGRRILRRSACRRSGGSGCCCCYGGAVRYREVVCVDSVHENGFPVDCDDCPGSLAIKDECSDNGAVDIGDDSCRIDEVGLVGVQKPARRVCSYFCIWGVFCRLNRGGVKVQVVDGFCCIFAAVDKGQHGSENHYRLQELVFHRHPQINPTRLSFESPSNSIRA